MNNPSTPSTPAPLSLPVCYPFEMTWHYCPRAPMTQLIVPTSLRCLHQPTSPLGKNSGAINLKTFGFNSCTTDIDLRVSFQFELDADRHDYEKPSAQDEDRAAILAVVTEWGKPYEIEVDHIGGVFTNIRLTAFIKRPAGSPVEHKLLEMTLDLFDRLGVTHPLFRYNFSHTCGEPQVLVNERWVGLKEYLKENFLVAEREELDREREARLAVLPV